MLDFESAFYHLKVSSFF